jgi:prepilin-type processing-associated H-X9-DG protein
MSGANDRDDYDDRPRRARRDDRDDDDDRPRRGRRDGDEGDRARSQSNGLAVAGLILGILSFVTLCLTGVPAVICSLLALGKPVGRGLAIAGLILGLLGTVAGIGLGVWAYTTGVERVRLTAMRLKDQNNMKQVGLGMHAAHDRQHGWSQYARDDFGKTNTGLSFRVELLPYIEQAHLYRKFNVQEPWDGPTNRSPSNTPIGTYTTPYDGEAPSTKTPYRVFVGGGAIFEENGSSVSLLQIRDGTSNTILAVHAAEQVPWAEPRELKYDPKGPLPKFGHPAQTGGFNVLMADGSVHFVTDKVSERNLRLAITKDDGQVLPFDWWDH